MKMFVDQNMRFGLSSHSIASPFSSSSSMNSSFSSDGSNWDSSSTVDSPLHTPVRASFDFVKLEDANFRTSTPSTTPGRQTLNSGLCTMSSMDDNMLSGFSDPSIIFAADGKLLSGDNMMEYNNFAPYIGPSGSSFSTQSCLALDSQSFDGDLFSPISDFGSSHTEDFVVPLQFNMSYDTPASDNDSGFEQFIPSYPDMKSCSATPCRPSPLRQPTLETLQTAAALQQIQEQSPDSKEGFQRTLAEKRTRKNRMRAIGQDLLPNINCAKSPTKQCPWEGCNRRFRRQEHLKRHERTHTKEDLFECEFCGKYFNRTDNLKDHILRHTLPYKKSSRTTFYPGAQALYDRMGRKSATKSATIKRELEGNLKARSRARVAGH
jgi:zinc finger protein BrlA